MSLKKYHLPSWNSSTLVGYHQHKCQMNLFASIKSSFFCAGSQNISQVAIWSSYKVVFLFLSLLLTIDFEAFNQRLPPLIGHSASWNSTLMGYHQLKYLMKYFASSIKSSFSLRASICDQSQYFICSHLLLSLSRLLIPFFTLPWDLRSTQPEATTSDWTFGRHPFRAPKNFMSKN